MESVRVTRKYQVTIPRSVRERLGLRIGDRVRMEVRGNRVVMETPRPLEHPSERLWNLFGRPMDVDAVALVEGSWDSPRFAKKRR